MVGGETYLRKATAAYCLVIGFLMVVSWIALFATNQIPELANTPVRLAFLLEAEFLTAFGLIAAGMGLLSRRRWASTAYLVASGMLLYTVINTIGVFAQRGEPALAALFFVLLAVTALFLGLMTSRLKVSITEIN